MRSSLLIRAATVSVAATIVTACSDRAVSTEPAAVTAPSLAEAASEAPPLPDADDRILLDTRAALQQAASIIEALAVWGLGADARPYLGFTTDVDGAGTHAMRVDWPASGACANVSPAVWRELPAATNGVYIHWKQWLGRTATGGGLGAVGSFQVHRDDCGGGRFVGFSNRYGSGNRLEYLWTGSSSAPVRYRVRGLVSLEPNRGWTFDPQRLVGQVIDQTLYYSPESATGAGDGVMRLWVNGRLLIDSAGLSLGTAPLSKFVYPWTAPAPLAEQSEYFWDLVIWEPGGTSEPPPPDAPVASVTVTPATARLQVGGTVQLTAVPRDATGAPLSGRAVAWTTSDAAVATVSGAGLVTARSTGSATITATSEGQSGTAAVAVDASTPGEDAVLVGAGDIAVCNSSDDEATAALLDGIAGTVFTAGDNVYEDGTAAEFANCYGPSWGRHLARTRPAPGNHDYHTSGASGYYGYFGAAAGDPSTGYYSYDLGAWHVVVLNSNISRSASSAQLAWLRADLAESDHLCTVAIWHHPRFSSGSHGNDASVAAFWDALFAADADLIVNGHEHDYERFAPQTPAGVADPAGGIRQFVVGTGGVDLRSFRSTIAANSEVRDAAHHGVLKLELSDRGYRWSFVTTPSGVVRDAGEGQCH